MKNIEEKGHIHPLTQIINEVVGAFSGLGFTVAEGPEIEDEYHNFDALNVPADHPARDMWDTFWLKSGNVKKLLRTHTSPVQIRYMEEMLKAGQKPPFRILVPGKCYRYEATDARHEAQFYQIEGLFVGSKVSVADMKGCLEAFSKKVFGPEAQVRLRPSFFPFVEPGFEVDMLCPACFGQTQEKKCSVCGGSGWLEIMGAGLVHPHVFESVGLDPKEGQGFAFGMGADRLAMVRWGVEDIRHFYNGDLRFIKQF